MNEYNTEDVDVPSSYYFSVSSHVSIRLFLLQKMNTRNSLGLEPSTLTGAKCTTIAVMSSSSFRLYCNCCKVQTNFFELSKSNWRWGWCQSPSHAMEDSQLYMKTINKNIRESGVFNIFGLADHFRLHTTVLHKHIIIPWKIDFL